MRRLLNGLTDRGWLLATIVVGGILRFINISKSSIWHDEGFTMMLSPMPLAEIILRTGRDVHPPLHYFLLHLWMQLFGTSELAARSLSVVFGLVTIAATFYLVKRLFGAPSARMAALFVAIGPFAVRYSQEARMWGLVAMLASLSTLMLVRWRQERRDRDLLLYALFLAAGLYTQYYAVFLIPVHWIYVLADSWQKKDWRGGLLGWRWWGANVLAAGLFAPWLPVAYEQFTRIQGGFWIPKTTWGTVPGTLGQFLTFTDLGRFPLPLRVGLLFGFLGLIMVAAWRHRDKLSSWILMAAYMGFGPLAVLILSIKRPIYIDRYFVFSATAFYAMAAILIYYAPRIGRYRMARRAATVILVLVFCLGLRNVYSQSSHAMRQTMATVAESFQAGDALVAGEIYTFFDSSYYNRTGTEIVAYAPGDGFPGCCEGRSMLYDRPYLVVRDLNELRPPTGVVWVIGKTGPHDYFDNPPDHWVADGPRISNGYTAAQRFIVR